MAAIMKQQWERYQPLRTLSQPAIQKLIAGYTDLEITSFKLITTGCANSNFQIKLSDGQNILLRIYEREAKAMQREIALYGLLANKLPTPKVLYTNSGGALSDGAPFIIMNFINGTVFRDHILDGNIQAIEDISYQAGKLFVDMKQFTFKAAGFFDSELNITPFKTEHDLLHYALDCLNTKQVKKQLGQLLQQNLIQLLTTHQNLLQDDAQPSLVHADFDPANLLIQKKNGKYQISGLLDWEFAFAGNPLMDIGNYLRYADHLPLAHKRNFIAGITDSGYLLPERWLQIAKLIDLICLLGVLHRNTDLSRPLMSEDVRNLMSATYQNFDKYND